MCKLLRMQSIIKNFVSAVVHNDKVYYRTITGWIRVFGSNFDSEVATVKVCFKVLHAFPKNTSEIK